MKLYKILFILVFTIIHIEATSLDEIIKNTIKNNDNLKSLKNISKAKKENFNSVKNTLNPKVNIGTKYLQLGDDIRNIQVEKTTTSYIDFSLNLYDGGKSEAIKRQKKYEFESSTLDHTQNTKDIIQNIITLFFQTKTIEDTIEALSEKSKVLKAQYQRIKTKYDINMATIDEVLKLQAEYEANQYTIDELKYQREQFIQNLNILSGLKIKKLDNISLDNINNISYKESENIRSLKLDINSQNENINIASSVLKPQIKLEDSYNIYNYDNYNSTLLTDLPSNQNQLMFLVSLNIFDTTTKSKIESSKLTKQALKQKLNYEIKQEKMLFNLAKQKLITQKSKIKSLKSAVDMSNSVYDIIKVKYQNGVVDNITFLDALSKKTYNTALYKQALNDYEIAKIDYYFKSGSDYNMILNQIFNKGL
jgi:outer membrane protein TolC